MKKKIVTVLLAATMAFSLAACGTGKKADGNETTADTKATTESKEAGKGDDTKKDGEKKEVVNLEPSGKIVIGDYTEPSGDMHPFWNNAGSDYNVYKMQRGYTTVAMTRDAKYIYDETVVKDVEETENEDGSKTWTYTIQPDLKWSDGKPVTAKDYVFGVLFKSSKQLVTDLEATTLAQEVYQYYKGYSKFIDSDHEAFEGVHLLGEDKFSVTVDSANLPYYYGKAWANVEPLDMKAWLPADVDIEETENGAKFTENYTAEYIKDSVDAERWNPTTSCGAYVNVGYDQGAYSYTLKINPEYKGNFEGKKANIETVVYKFSPEDTMMDEVKTSTVDLLLQLADGKEINAGLDMVDAGTHGYLSYPRDGYGKLVFKSNVGPTQFVEVRQAIAYLLDRNEFAKTFTGGHGSVVNGPYGLSQWMVEEAEDKMDELNTYSYSKEKAIEVLEKGGWTKDENGNDYSGTGLRYKEVDGELMPLVIRWCSSENNAVSDLLVTMLAQNPDVEGSGMKIEQYIVTFTELLKGYNTDVGDYNMFNMAVNFSVPYDAKFEYEIDGDSNFNRINDEELAATSAGMNKVEEGDDDAYLEEWFKFTKHWNEVLPDLPLYSNEYHDIYTKRVVGYEDKNAFWDLESAILYTHVED